MKVLIAACALAMSGSAYAVMMVTAPHAMPIDNVPSRVQSWEPTAVQLRSARAQERYWISLGRSVDSQAYRQLCTRVRCTVS